MALVGAIVKEVVRVAVKANVLFVLRVVKILVADLAVEIAEIVILLALEDVREVVKILVMAHALVNVMCNVLAQNKIQ